MKKSFYFLLFFFVSVTKLLGQFNSRNPTSPSISLSADNQNLQVSNDYYNGKVNTTIPIMNYQFEEIAFPIELTYAGGNGIKADEVPTWVGLGWNLKAGGYIRRTVRGRADEARDFKTLFYRIFDTNTGNPVPQTWTETTLNPTDFSYLTNYGKTYNNGNANWSSYSYFGAFHASSSNYSFPSTYSLGQYQGTVTAYNPAPSYDLVPDEFTFSFGTFSGKFYLNHENKWVVQSNDGRNYSVAITVGPVDLGNISCPRVIHSLTLTSDDGIKYVFGNENSQVFTERLFEYSRSSSSQDIFSQEYWYWGPLIEIVPHTWHLSKIVNLKTGSSVTLNYEKSGFQFYKNRQAWGDATTGYVWKDSHYGSSMGEFGLVPSASAVTKIGSEFFTLSNINFPNGVQIKFESSNSAQRATNVPLDEAKNGFMRHIDYHNYAGVNRLKKLDKIKLLYNNQLINENTFSYIENDLTHRLKLASIKQTNGALEKQGYSFEYNVNQLPEYAWGETDHWGYYNHKDFFLSVLPPYNSSNLTQATFSSYKEPDYAYVESEILKKINHPTGGVTEFVYEPNSYSIERNPTTLALTNLSTNKNGAGVRIKEIKYYTNSTNLSYTKEYAYGKLNDPAISSGVLSSSIPPYVAGTSNSLRSQGFNPQYYSGNPVTYTNVIEKMSGNGSTSYIYSNYDNNYNDALPISSNSNIYVLGFESLYKNNSFKRGKLLKAIVKNETSQTLKETEYGYVHDLSESTQPEVRSIYLKEHGYNTFVYGAVSDRVYNNSILSSKETDYSGSASSSVTTSNIFDSYGNIKETSSIDSKGDIVKKRYKYAYEFSSQTPSAVDEASLGLKFLLEKKCGATIIEEIVTRESGGVVKVESGSLTTYKNTSAYPSKVYVLNITDPILYNSFSWTSISGGNFVKDSRYFTLPEKNFTLYSNNGRVLESVDKSTIPVSNILGYNNQYIIAEVRNALNADIAATSFESNSNGNFTFSGVPLLNSLAVTGNNVYPLTASNAITKTISSSNNYTVSVWSTNNSVRVNGIAPSIIGRSLNGFTYYQFEISGAGSISLTGSADIDELRLYPKDAEMTTLTYSPVVGVTTECDINNKITYYNYDAFNRLVLVRDQDKNVVKKICYNYSGQPEDCSTPCIDANPIWQNTAAPLRCETDANCQYTGYQVQEQIDVNNCPGNTNYGKKRWARAVYNPTICPVGAVNIPIYYTNNITGSWGIGYVATYTNTTSGGIFQFDIPQGTGTLGCIPSGRYNLRITSPAGVQYPVMAIFGNGCSYQSGTTTVMFSNMMPNFCNQVTIDYDL